MFQALECPRQQWLVVSVNLQDQILKVTDAVIQIFFQFSHQTISSGCFVFICQEDEARDPSQQNSVMERAEPCCKTVMKKQILGGKKHLMLSKISARFFQSVFARKQPGSVNNW